MKIKDDFITRVTGEDNMIVSSGSADFSGIVKGNETAGIIFDLLKNETNEENIVSAIYNKYDAPIEIIEQDVKKIINELRKIGAIDE